ncbi:response regulator transcription factor [Pseudoalteromonas luteoviolacea]|uniref:response regulator transcription factor n=1 Tax=Pseudoalteromonas luteoviolacea TaxID=43657 RepID=UPI001F2BDDF6|nr:response regulator transcription factor [Pseudoalteromonas luteoviolacea]MCF6442946.1 response regulator transcription factor [Pseudoalteromonas luteoviolacea]
MKILVVEDQALVRNAISALLSLEVGLEDVAQVEDGLQAIDFLASNSPDIVLTDIEMPNMTGLELAQEVQEKHPKVKVVIMTTFSRSGYIRRAMASDVKGFILKEAPSDYLVNALKKVSLGQKVIDPELAMNALDDNDPLSDKERKALRLAGEGLKTKQIAESLYLSEGTVRNYLSDAIAKLNATNRIDAARIARQKGWL